MHLEKLESAKENGSPRQASHSDGSGNDENENALPKEEGKKTKDSRQTEAVPPILSFDDPNHLIALTTLYGELLTKRIMRDGSEQPYDHAMWFKVNVLDCSTDERLLDAVKRLGEMPHTMLVLGAVRPRKNYEKMLRRKKPRPREDGNVEPPTLVDVPRSIYMLDCDSIEPPPGLDPHDLAAAARHVRTQLPPAFHGVRMILVATAGYLRKPGLRFRIFVRLSRPLLPKQMKAWFLLTKPLALKKPIVDLAVFDTIQANYTAWPVFDDPSMDPLPGGRIVVLEGVPAVQTPDPETLIAPPKPKKGRPAKPQKAATGPPAKPQKAQKEKPASKPRQPQSGHPTDDRIPVDLYAHADLVDDEEAHRLGQQFLEHAAPAVEGDGGRKRTMTVLMKLGDFGLSFDAALDLMIATGWAERCDGPWCREELEAHFAGLFEGRDGPLGCGRVEDNWGKGASDDADEPDGRSGRLEDYLVDVPKDAPTLEPGFVNRLRADRLVRERIIPTVLELATSKGSNAPPVKGLAVTTGGKKTGTAITAVVSALVHMRGQGDQRPIVYAVPRHKLGGEVKDRFETTIAEQGAELKVAVWRGREADDPRAPGKTMCLNVDAVRQAQAVKMDVERHVCASCEHREKCAYLEQRHQRGDVWIVPHQSLLNAPPKAMIARGEIALIVIDETIEQAPLIGLDPPIELPLEALHPGGMRLPSAEGEQRDFYAQKAKLLQEDRERLRRAFEAAPRGPVRRETLEPYFTGASSYQQAAWAEKMRIYRGEGEGSYEDNLSIDAAVLMWRPAEQLLQDGAPEASGRLEVIDAKSAEGVVSRRVRMRGYGKIHPGFSVPALLLDANFDADRLRALFPQIEDIGAIRIEAPPPPAVTVLKAIGGGFAKYKLEPRKFKKPEEPTKAELARDDLAARRRRKLKAFICAVARKMGGKTLVIGNKAVIEAMNLPPHILRGHFNDISGIDSWGDVRTQIIIGATLPRPGAAEDIVAAMTGKEPNRMPINPATGRPHFYPRRQSRHIVRRGSQFVGVYAEEFRHPDPDVDRVLRRIHEGELEQAVGRARPINRDRHRPLLQILLTDAVHDFPVDHLFDGSWAYSASPRDMQLAEGGIAFESPAHAAKAYPELFSNAKAAQKALERSKEHGDISLYSNLSIRKCRRVLRVTYQLTGKGQKKKHCWVDPVVIPDPKAVIESMLGLLKLFIMEGSEEQQQQPDRTRNGRVEELEIGSGEASSTAPEVEDLGLCRAGRARVDRTIGHHRPGADRRRNGCAASVRSLWNAAAAVDDEGERRKAQS